MKREIVKTGQNADYGYIVQLLSKGYVMDPMLTDGKPYRLEDVIVWPMVLYESDDEKPKIEAKKGELEDVESILSVDLNQADQYLQQGYVVHEAFAKTVTLIKRKGKAE